MQKLLVILSSEIELTSITEIKNIRSCCVRFISGISVNECDLSGRSEPPIIIDMLINLSKEILFT